MTKVAGIILAAGKGTRMKSSLPKVLHPLAGRPMLTWVVDSMRATGVDSICLVLSEDIQDFDPYLKKNPDLRVAIQKNRQGTGDAVASTAWSFAKVKPAPYAAGRAHQGTPIDCDHVLISAGDTPALHPSSLQAFIDTCRDQKTQLGVLGMRIPDPFGYGRMVLDGTKLRAIIEEKDADQPTRRIDVVNTGIIFAERELLFDLLADLKPNNSQQEYYLTDCVKLAWQRGITVNAHVTDRWQEFLGINDRSQLANVEAVLVRRKLESFMLNGVTVCLPATVFVDEDVTVGADAEIGANVTLRGKTTVGAGARIGAGSVLENVAVKDGEVVPPLSVRVQTI